VADPVVLEAEEVDYEVLRVGGVGVLVVSGGSWFKKIALALFACLAVLSFAVNVVGVVGGDGGLGGWASAWGCCGWGVPK
jgi:hypothetical protein